MKLAKPPRKLSTSPPAPAGLSKERQTLWHSMVKGFHIFDPASLNVLADALRADDAIAEHRKILKRDGLSKYRDPRGVLRSHPSEKQIVELTKLKLACFRILKIDFVPGAKK